MQVIEDAEFEVMRAENFVPLRGTLDGSVARREPERHSVLGNYSPVYGSRTEPLVGYGYQSIDNYRGEAIR